MLKNIKGEIKTVGEKTVKRGIPYCQEGKKCHQRARVAKTGETESPDLPSGPVE